MTIFFLLYRTNLPQSYHKRQFLIQHGEEKNRKSTGVSWPDSRSSSNASFYIPVSSVIKMQRILQPSQKRKLCRVNTNQNIFFKLDCKNQVVVLRNQCFWCFIDYMVSEKFNTDILYICIYCINVYIVIYIIVIYVSLLYIFTFSVSENEEQLHRLPIRQVGSTVHKIE